MIQGYPVRYRYCHNHNRESRELCESVVCALITFNNAYKLEGIHPPSIAVMQ